MTALTPEQIALVRAAVAKVQEECGLWELSRRTLAGEMDLMPAMQGALAAARAVLSGGAG